MSPHVLLGSRLSALLIACLVGAVTVACGEKKSAATSTESGGTGSGKNNKDKTDKDGDPDEEGGEEGGDEEPATEEDGQITIEGDGGKTETFDVCNAVKANTKFDDVRAEATALCGLLKALRNPDVAYSGQSDARIREKDRVLGDEKSSIKLYGMTLAESSAADYFALVNSQLRDQTAYKADNCFNPNTSITKEAKKGDDAMEYLITVLGSSGTDAAYKARTTYITLKKDAAYAVVTKRQDSSDNKRVSELRGVILILKKEAKKTEAFTYSFQEYDHEAGKGQSYLDEALTTLMVEQKSMYINAKGNVDKAKCPKYPGS